jgi:hypothetical protein
MSPTDLQIALTSDDLAFNVELVGNLIVQEGIVNPTASDVQIAPIPGLSANTVQAAIAQLHQGYVYTQSVPATEWIVNHNFGFYPQAEVFIDGGTRIVGDVLNQSLNQLRVYFSQPNTGRVRCT